MSTATARPPATAYDVERIRRDFPILSRRVHGKPLVYLDNAATTQKPSVVIDTMRTFYENSYANIHRGVHALSVEASEAYEKARERAREFINAADTREVIFVRGTTEGINLVAQTYGRAKVSRGDEVVISALEHHSNIVPWQILCEERGAKLVVAPIDEGGEIRLDVLENLLSERTRLVAVSHVSNALGTRNPVRKIAALAHSRGVPVLIDGAQAAPRIPVDVRDLDCDFYTFSGHKMYGPTGVGILYAKAKLLEEMPPYQGGGDMISSVTFEKTTWNILPYKFEAGTPNIVGAIGLARAMDFLTALGMDAIEAHEDDLLTYATERLSAVPGLRIVGTAKSKAAVLSFTLQGVHPHDVGTVLDREGVAVRTGHHCAQPVMDFFRIPATTRASFGLYNTREEVDVLERGIQRVQEMFRL